MSKRRVYALVSGLAAVAAVALILVLVILPASSGGMRGAEESSVGTPVAAPAVQETASRPGGTQEGISIHGHWTVEVRDPDGSLVERREFDNALVWWGEQTLVQMLAGDTTPGWWAIALSGAPVDPCWYDVSSSPMDCVACEPGDIEAERSYGFDTLTVTVVGEANSAKLVLSGYVTVATTTEISQVHTRLTLCAPDVSPADCVRGLFTSSGPMTQATVSPYIPVVAGQIVMVTVEISFN